MPRVLVANRGEIAIRILRSATELGWDTITIYTERDTSHTAYADEAVKLKSVADFLDVEAVTKIALSTKCTHLHPGYGFLSENPALPLALAKSGSDITFVGPSPDTLRISSDKILSRNLATSLQVNVAAGTRVSSSLEVRAFAERIGYPVMIKALDGGGGRGIRVVESADKVDEAYKRCLGESPSRQVFVEQALTGASWKHIEVQIIGDGTGAVNHFWERECSVQRRFQKVVEFAPSRMPVAVIRPLLEASLKIASHLKYKGLGTFEYLINTQSHEWVFLEINPRVQVEHTVTEEIVDRDLVRAQMLLFTPSQTLSTLSLFSPVPRPTSHAVQLRLTAEDPTRGFQLSPGIIRSADVAWPAGRGIRVDTWLSSGPNNWTSEWIVGTDFDSLLAKVIVRGGTFEEMTAKACRALKELEVGGDVKTNVAVLAGVIDHPDWLSGAIDTLWLERNAASILELGAKAVASPRGVKGLEVLNTPATNVNAAASTNGNTMLQPGALFHLTLAPTTGSPSAPEFNLTRHTLTLSSIGQNAFPDKLTGTLQTSLSPTPFSFSLSQSSSAAVSSSAFELADPNNASHVGSPLTGKVVELHAALMDAVAGGTSERVQHEKRRVKKGDTLLVLSVMKMENVVLSPCDGFVERIGKGIKVGVVLGEGMLVCIVNPNDGTGSKSRL